MLATLVHDPFHKTGWVYEEKYDGDRILAYKEGDRVRLLSRNAIDRTANFPMVSVAIRHLRPETLLLDGEIVVFDKKGVSRFQLLQQSKGTPVYAVFDCVYCNGRDLRREPLALRREELERAIGSKAVGSKTVLLPSHRLAKNGLEAFEEAKQCGYEGVVAKNLSSTYEERRSSNWLKVKVHQEDEFVIGGFTQPTGSRQHFGALLLGAFDHGKLRYVGKVGAGFNEKTLAALHKKFQPLIRKQAPFINPPREKGVTFVTPRLVAQISFQEWTADTKLRQPVFLGLRDDKPSEEVELVETPA